MVTCARSATGDVLGELYAQMAALRAANSRLREVIEAKDAELPAKDA
jgi:hypothetical protein